MNNTALISLSVIVLFGLSACSSNSGKTQSTKEQATSAQNTNQYTHSQKAPQRATQPFTASRQNYYQQQWNSKQKALQAEQEQKRLAYNRNWQNQQHQLAQQKADEQIKQAAQAHARKVWQAQEAARKQAQQKKAQQAAQQYAMLQQRNRPPAPSQQPQRGIASLSQSEIRTIGDKIFRNESGGDIDKLVHWNNGENFASMGIGHFTWYPSGRRNRYGNTFPGLLDHLQNNGVRLPLWVKRARHTGAPWRTKAELRRAKHSPQVREFQNLLYETRYLQANYIFERAKRAMPKLVKASPPRLRSHVAQNLNAVANTRGGWYALIDYVNFKGEGLNRKGGYRGQNWGLLQVLENMRPSQPGQMALNNFADSAIQVLERRVRNSNPKRNEARWLRGWTIRINSYRHPFVI